MHTHSIKFSPEIGKTYTWSLNDVALYSATVESIQGCWATVKVVNPESGKFEKQYQPGQRFDIKVALYEFEEK